MLFLLPFSGAVYLFVNATNSDITFTEKELIGIRYHNALFETMLAAQRYRGKSFMAAQLGIENPELIELNDAMRQLIALVDVLAKEAAILGLTERWVQVKTKMMDAREHQGSHKPI